MGNQELCCKYRDSNDPNAQNFGNGDMAQQDGLNPKQQAKAKEMAALLDKFKGQDKLKLVIKLQAVMRGHMQRKRQKQFKDQIDA